MFEGVLSLSVLASALRLLPPERAHGATLWALRHGLGPRLSEPDDPILACALWGRSFGNPIGIAAGFDKNAEAPAALRAMGFGFVEVGSVTPRPQPGNPRPRLFRLPEDGAVINRMGFNNDGVSAVAARLKSYRAAPAGTGRPARRAGPVGVNLGKNRDSVDAGADYAEGVAGLARFADYLAINVSSPNTPGLRALQGPDELRDLIARVQEVLAAQALDAPPPVLVKVAPDLTDADLEDIAGVALETGLGGLIATNSTIARPDSLGSRHRQEAGGLSGRPLFRSSTEILSRLYRLTRGELPLIGVGGIASGADALTKIRAGAALVQLYSALVFGGPALLPRIKRDLAAGLRRQGFATVAEAVGADHRDAG